jgi:DNA topoisomerase I
VDVNGAGLTRRRRGRGFSYHHPDGSPVTDPVTLDRIRALAIPPAWRDVWICPRPNGHIQAVGTDDAGRRQYRYHDQWRIARDAEKHDRVLRLAARLPRLRREVTEQLVSPGLGRERVLATALRMLDIGMFRIGREEYAPRDEDDDGTFGLSTLRREHVCVRRGTVLVEYLGKGGIQQSVAIRDELLCRAVASLLRRRDEAPELFVYRDAKAWRPMRADEVNLRIKELVGNEFTAKDLRTWNATVLAAAALGERANAGAPKSQTGRRKAVVAAVREVAEMLGNTPTVARKSYIDPRVIECFSQGVTVEAALRRAGSADLSDDRARHIIERAVLRMLRDYD